MKPSVHLQNALKKFREEQDFPEPGRFPGTICLHYRFGASTNNPDFANDGYKNPTDHPYSPEGIDWVIDCMRNYSSVTSKWFVATDWVPFFQMINDSRVVYVQGVPKHVGRDSSESSLEKVWLDHTMLSLCDVEVSTSSGFVVSSISRNLRPSHVPPLSPSYLRSGRSHPELYFNTTYRRESLCDAAHLVKMPRSVE